MDLSHLGHPGAHPRPVHLKVKDHIASAVPPFDWSQIKEDPIGNIPKIFGVTDRDQGQGGTCTAQATGYGFSFKTGIEISREDMYSHTHLPGGGAYLVAPLDWLRNNGYLLLSMHPDPSPQTEDNMSVIIQVKDGERIRTFQLTYKIYPDTNNIDSAAWATTQHDYIHLGINGSWTDGWQNPVDPNPPTPGNTNFWGHALFSCKEGIVLRNSQKTIKAKSSWNNSGVHAHYLNNHYFSAGGVFEILGVDVKEISMGQFVKITDTEYGLEYVTDFVTTVVKFTSEPDAKEKLKNVPGALNADGSVNFVAARIINL